GVMSIFYVVLASMVTSGSKLYLEQTVMGNSEALVEGVADDIKGYLLYGKDIKVFYHMSQEDADKRIVGVDCSGYFTGKSDIPGKSLTMDIYVEKIGSTYYAVGQYSNPIYPDQSISPIITASDPFIGNGIDLGFKKIYLDKGPIDGTTGKKKRPDVIQGLSYSGGFYQGLDLDLQIIDEGMMNAVTADQLRKQGLYTVTVSGKGPKKSYEFQSDVSVASLNDKHR
ncbi:MAG: hypothetical protein RR446_05510, partial [Lachnospiraceae bacterium]